MEDLTKTQIILLTLLVSFVTSIATGIVTVSLVDQAPPALTQTINRVVERTVEKVTPGQPASVITKETTVVIKEEDLIIDAVDKNKRNVVIFKREGKSDGLGFLVSQDGIIATDSSIPTELGSSKIILSNGKEYSYDILYSGSGFALVKVILSEEDSVDTKFSRVSLTDSSSIRLGQTIIALGGIDDRTILTGVVSKINTEEISDNNTSSTTQKISQKIVTSIETNLVLNGQFEGGPLIDVDGLVVGINVESLGKSYTLPSRLILERLNALSTTAEADGTQDKKTN